MVWHGRRSRKKPAGVQMVYITLKVPRRLKTLLWYQADEEGRTLSSQITRIFTEAVSKTKKVVAEEKLLEIEHKEDNPPIPEHLQDFIGTGDIRAPVEAEEALEDNPDYVIVDISKITS